MMGFLLFVVVAVGLIALMHDHDRNEMRREALDDYKRLEYHHLYPTSN